MDGTAGRINCFIVEPFVPHQAEYYLCLQSDRQGVTLSFSEHGGMDIESNWDKVRGGGEGGWDGEGRGKGLVCSACREPAAPG